jgi:hypothetical protein
MNHAIKDFLKTRLHLETSDEKSKDINLKKNSSEFLGFSFRAIRKGNTRFGYVAQSNMTKKAKSNALIKIKDSIKAIQKKPCAETVWHYNTVVMGIQNYYAAATNISNNLSVLSSRLNKTLYNRLKNVRTEAKFEDMTSTLQKRYKGYSPQYYKIQNMVFVPIYVQRHKKNLCFSQNVCNYTAEGRAKIHINLKAIYKNFLSYVMKNFIPNRSIEYNDNRISKFIAQYGKCAVTGVELGKSDWHCHHKIPYYISKDDHYSNLIVLHEGFGSYPGLAIVFHQEEMVPDKEIPRYLDLGQYAIAESVPYTHSSNLLSALHEAVKQVDLEKRHTLGNAAKRKLTDAGFRILGNEEYSPGIVTTALTDTISSKMIGDQLKEKGIIISYESSYLLERNWIQFAFMGDLTWSEIEAAITIFEEIIDCYTERI